MGASMFSRRLTWVLLAGTMLSTVALTQAVLAADADTTTTTTTTTKSKTEPTNIGNVKAGDSEGPATSVTGVTRTDTGGGLMIEEDTPKTHATVTQDFIQKQTPGTNVTQLVTLVPGANLSTQDPFGMKNGNLTMRGLDQSQMGFTFEGAPVNEATSYSFFTNEWGDMENIQQLSLAQGAADLDSPHIEASGGTMDINYREPSMKPAGFIDLSTGSFGANRGFVRGDTGLIGDTGIRGFLSYSQAEAKNYRGPGRSERDHIDFKLLKDFAGGSRLSFVTMYNHQQVANLLDPTMAQWQAKGNSFNYDSTDAPNDTNYYKLRRNPYWNLLFTGTASVVVSDALTVDFTPYFYHGWGTGGGASNVNESSFYVGTNHYTNVDLDGNGTIGTARLYSGYTNAHYRPGAILKASYLAGINKFVAGYWFEYSNDREWIPYQRINSQGKPYDYSLQDPAIVLPDGTYLRSQDQRTNTYIHTFWQGDTISLMGERLKLDIGVKEAFIKRDGFNYIPGATADVSLTNSMVLPTAAIRYALDDKNQIFASFSSNFRATPSSTLYDGYSISSGAITNVANTGQKPEKSFSQEIGHRFQGDLFDTSISAFHYKFKNRQVQTSTNINGLLYNSYINAGGMTSYGIDGEVGLKPYHNFRPYVSGELLNTRIDDNYKVGNDYLPTKGKNGVRAPHLIAAAAIDYDDGTFFGNAALKYTGSQYSTFMNDESIPGYVDTSFTVGYRFPAFGPLSGTEIRLNATNLLDREHLSGVDGARTNAKATTGVNGTTINGSAPTYFTYPSNAVMVTLSTGF